MNLQRQLSVVVDNALCTSLDETPHEEKEWPSMRRLEEHRDPDISRGWLLRKDRADGPSVPKDDNTMAFHLRLRAQMVE